MEGEGGEMGLSFSMFLVSAGTVVMGASLPGWEGSRDNPQLV
jgi:hypothetical protein